MKSSAKGGLARTLDLLTRTNNEAATSALLNALDHPDRNLQAAALRALVRRRSVVGHRELLRRWDGFSERWKAMIAEQGSRMSGAVRDALLGGDEKLAENGAEAVLRLRDYELIPSLLAAAEDPAQPRGGKAARAVLGLSEMLSEESAAPEDNRRRDPQRTRQYLIGSLERAVSHFDQHRNNDIVEAFLLLATSGNATLRRLLQNPHDKAYAAVVQLLGHSTRAGIQRLLLSFLDDPQAPSAIHTLLSQRRDVPFLKRFFQRIKAEVSKPVQLNLRRIETFSWLCSDLKVLKAISEEEQEGVVHLVAAAGISRLQAFEVIKEMLSLGGLAARRAASLAL
jgi:hypothetical protein